MSALVWLLIAAIALILIAAIALGLGGSAKEPPTPSRPPPAAAVDQQLLDGLEQIQQQLADLLEFAHQSRHVLAIAELRHIGIRIEFAIRALEPR